MSNPMWPGRGPKTEPLDTGVAGSILPSAMATQSSKKAPVSAPESVKWPFGKKNYIWFGVALAVMTIGFVLLGTGDTTLAPILLVIAYCALIPTAILVKGQPDNGSPADQTASKS